MRVFFSEPDGSTWMEELPTVQCGNEIQYMEPRPALAWFEYKSLDVPEVTRKRYKFKGMSYVEGKGIMFYDRIEE